MFFVFFLIVENNQYAFQMNRELINNKLIIKGGYCFWIKFIKIKAIAEAYLCLILKEVSVTLLVRRCLFRGD